VRDPAEDSAARSARRRRERSRARRRRVNARVDVAIGVLIAIVAILAAPGLAIVALFATIAFVACLLSLGIERRRRMRAARHDRETRPVR
jgi:Flp pilus assembly protein TadB